MRKTLIPTLTAVAVLVAMSFVTGPIVRQLLYPAPPVPVPSPPPAPLAEVALDLDGAAAVAWAYDHADERAPAVLFFHGNGENLATLQMAGLYGELARLGVHFLAVDYPGYGRSGGTPSEASLVASALAGLEQLETRHPRAPKILLGWSLGAAVAVQCAAAANDRVDGLVLLSAWADLRSLAKTHYPGWLVGLALDDTYDSRAAARRVSVPVLQIHGTADAVIPIVQGRELHRALGGTARWIEVEEAGHNDLLSRPEVWRELGAFLRRLG